MNQENLLIKQSIEKIIILLKQNEKNSNFFILKNNFLSFYKKYQTIKSQQQVLDLIKKHKQDIYKKYQNEKESIKKWMRKVSLELNKTNENKQERIKNLTNIMLDQSVKESDEIKSYLNLRMSQSQNIKNSQRMVTAAYEQAYHAAEALQKFITKKLYNNENGIQVLYTHARFKDKQIPLFFYETQALAPLPQHSKNMASMRYQNTYSTIQKHKNDLRKLNPFINSEAQQALKKIHNQIQQYASDYSGRGKLSFSTTFNKQTEYTIYNIGDYWEGFAYWYYQASSKDINQLIQLIQKNSIDAAIDLFIRKGAWQVDTQHGFFSADINNIYAIKSFKASTMNLSILYNFFSSLHSLLKNEQQLYQQLKKDFFDKSTRNKINNELYSAGKEQAENYINNNIIKK